ncbi:MAG: hypothetical protein Ct9H300mP18_08310 [Candidatus Neomarinimicrobiota bacterium]|nr:MAG: hypothetical protein Ct9H300mP18_08310 [Candidatus Neomarinimicrobiota bacterium]
MKIAVLVKQVPGPESPLPLVSNEDWLDESQVAYIMNESDNYALEEALRYAKKKMMEKSLLLVLGQIGHKKLFVKLYQKELNPGIHIQSQDKYPK